MDEMIAARSSSGSSLLETLAVLAIVGILIGIVATQGAKWDRAERERASEREVCNALCAARQAAMTKGTTAWVRYGTDAAGRGFLSLDTAADGLIGSTGLLARGVGILPVAGCVAFGRDGRGLDASPPWTNGIHELTLTRAGSTNAAAAFCRITVAALSGAVEVRHE